MTIETKEIVDEYILLCYDLPATASKARKKFLKKALQVGAMMYTASVYLMPYSSIAMKLAEELAATGTAVIWRSKQENKAMAKIINMQYDQHLKEKLEIIMGRLIMIQDHIECYELSHANKMVKKTSQMIDDLKVIAQTYHPDWLTDAIGDLETNLAQVKSA